MSFTDYTAIEAMNWSSLKHMAVSPRLYHWRTKHPRPDTPAFLRGRAMHCRWLEPDAYGSRYTSEPEWEHDGRTSLGKAERADWRILHEDCKMLTSGAAAIVEHCAESLRGHPDAMALLDGAQTEVVAEWTDADTGVACKARLDILKPLLVADLKTCSELAWFDRDAGRYLYHGQIAWYLDGAIAAGLAEPGAAAAFAAVETSEPYDCGKLSVGPMTVERGRALYRRLLDLYVQCRETGLWPGQIPTTRELELSPWAKGGKLDEAEGW